jgi:membrane protein
MSAALSALGRWASALPGSVYLWQAVNAIVSLGLIIVLFAMIYQVLPDARIRWRDVWVGALVTALLFVFGKHLLGLYLGNSATASVYGAAGSVVVILLWVYYSSQILLFGAEFTRVYANRRGERVRPTPNAISVAPEDLARQGMPAAESVAAVGGDRASR